MKEDGDKETAPADDKKDAEMKNEDATEKPAEEKAAEW